MDLVANRSADADLPGSAEAEAVQDTDFGYNVRIFLDLPNRHLKAGLLKVVR